MKKLTFLTILLASIATIALAEPPQGGPGFGKDGAKHGGFGKHGAKLFEDMDGNHDGKVTLAEMKAGAERRATEHFKRMDANGDGAVTKDELGKGRGHGDCGGHGHGGPQQQGAAGSGPEL